MKKIILLVSGAVAVVALIISMMWISAYNGAVTREAEIVEKQGNVHAALSARYEKVGALIDAIEGANATVLGYLETIADARTAFANALAAGSQAAADAAADTIDATFITLLSYMEDNPDSYNTVNLYSGFAAEFSASTNLVTGSIILFNVAVTNYNTHVQTFPNNIFLGGRALYSPYELTNYNVPLPTFN